jgi:hypothetical protein
MNEKFILQSGHNGTSPLLRGYIPELEQDIAVWSYRDDTGAPQGIQVEIVGEEPELITFKLTPLPGSDNFEYMISGPNQFLSAKELIITFSTFDLICLEQGI